MKPEKVSKKEVSSFIKDFYLKNSEITEGTVQSGKFSLLLKFDGIIVKGNTMTINELAKIVEKLATKVDEGFTQVNKRLDEHSAILEKHSLIFERNNLK